MLSVVAQQTIAKHTFIDEKAAEPHSFKFITWFLAIHDSFKMVT